MFPPWLSKAQDSSEMVCMCLVPQWCLTLCNPMDSSMPDFSVILYLLEFTKLISIELVMPSNHLILCISSFICEHKHLPHLWIQKQCSERSEDSCILFIYKKRTKVQWSLASSRQCRKRLRHDWKAKQQWQHLSSLHGRLLIFPPLPVIPAKAASLRCFRFRMAFVLSRGDWKPNPSTCLSSVSPF